MVALILGALVLGEPLTWREAVGAAVIWPQPQSPWHRARRPQVAKRYDAVVFDLLTALIDSWTLWNASPARQDGLRWRREYLELTYRPAPTVLTRGSCARRPSFRRRDACADEFVRRWDELPPWPETTEILANCRARAARDRDQLLDPPRPTRAARSGAASRRSSTPKAGFYKPRPEPYRAVLTQLETDAGTHLVRGGLGRRRAGCEGRRHAGLLAQSHGAPSARDGATPEFVETSLGRSWSLCDAISEPNSLLALETPRLLLDLDRLERNCAAYARAPARSVSRCART